MYWKGTEKGKKMDLISCGVVEKSNLHAGKNKIADKYRPGQFIIENIGYYIKLN